MTFLLVITPFALGIDEAEAKASYKSGKKSFTPVTPKKAETNTNFKSNKDTTSTPKGTSTSSLSKGGLMKGLLYGGLAGFLFGSMLNGLGAFGAVLGFIVNILAIFVLLAIILAGFAYFKNSRKKQEAAGWKR